MPLTFLAFTDLHHNPQSFLHNAEEFLDVILQRSVDCRASFVIQLGDLLQNPAQNEALASRYNHFSLPTYNVLGNHDTDQKDLSYILRMYNLEKNYYSFDRDGYRFIVLDPNYAIVDGVLCHYAPLPQIGKRNHHRGEIPPEQLEWLEQTIADSPYPCILFSHQSIERTNGIRNRDEVWDILCAANRRKKHSVILCVNGHYHYDFCTILNGVCCLDLNSASYYWSHVKHTLYVPEVYEQFPFAANCIHYKKPLSALITLHDPDKIEIDGVPGEFTFPLSREELLYYDQKRLSEERLCSPSIHSYRVDLSQNIVETD